jgi:hypothetical protein
MQKCAFARVVFVTDRDYAIDGIDCVRIPRSTRAMRTRGS